MYIELERGRETDKHNALSIRVTVNPYIFETDVRAPIALFGTIVRALIVHGLLDFSPFLAKIAGVFLLLAHFFVQRLWKYMDDEDTATSAMLGTKGCACRNNFAIQKYVNKIVKLEKYF